MEKEFWLALGRNEYEIPDGYKIDELTKILFGYLGNLDPELRDDIAYSVYANWLKRDMYSPDEIRLQINELLANLEKGIGETESDSVFLRAFSVLLLAEIIHNDNKKSRLEKADIESVLKKGLWYLSAEKDPRGHIPIKGWAHALAHTADLMMVLGKNRHVQQKNLENILQGVSAKLVHSTNWLYIHGEDERLANAVIAIFERDLVSADFIKQWLASLTSPERSWVGAYMDDDLAKSFHNTRNFLRSLFIAVRSAENLPNKEIVFQLTEQSSSSLKPY